MHIFIRKIDNSRKNDERLSVSLFGGARVEEKKKKKNGVRAASWNIHSKKITKSKIKKNQENTSEITTHAHMRRASGYMSGWPALYESVSTQGGSFDRKSLIFALYNISI
jgi:hypothetical protein